MATENTNIPVTFTLSFSSFFLGALSRIGSGIEWLMDNSAGAMRAKKVQALHALSDAELAERGLKREEIVMYVFRDCAFA